MREGEGDREERWERSGRGKGEEVGQRKDR